MAEASRSIVSGAINHERQVLTQRIQNIDQVLSTGRDCAGIGAEIDSTIQSLSLIAAQLLKRRNACSPLFRLPPKILREIVSLVALQDRPQFFPLLQSHAKKSPFPSTNTLGWISLTHICHSFRALILDDRAAWASVVVLVPKGHDELLLRAVDTPLTIALDTTSYKLPKTTIDFVISNLHRARIFELKERPSKRALWTATVLEKIARAATNGLERLVVDMTQRWEGEWAFTQREWPERYHLPFLHAPRLLHLSLRNSYIPTLAPCLTYLELAREGPVIDDTLPPADALFATLRGSPQLRVLRLINTIPVLTDLHDAAISFPLLTELSLSGSRTRCVALWSHLVLPTLTNLCFHIDYIDDLERNMRHDDGTSLGPIHDSLRYPFLQNLAQRIADDAASAAQPIIGLYIEECLDRLHICLCASEADKPEGDRYRVGPFGHGFVSRLDISYDRWDTTDPKFNFDNTLECVAAVLRLSQIETLGLESTLSVRHDIFSQFTAVRTLVLRSMSDFKLLGDSLPTGVMPFPALCTLRLAYIHLPGPFDGMDNGSSRWDDCEEGFFEILAYRSKKECGVQELTLKKITLYNATRYGASEGLQVENLIARAKDVVPQVEVYVTASIHGFVGSASTGPKPGMRFPRCDMYIEELRHAIRFLYVDNKNAPHPLDKAPARPCEQTTKQSAVALALRCMKDTGRLSSVQGQQQELRICMHYDGTSDPTWIVVAATNQALGGWFKLLLGWMTGNLEVYSPIL
ncbi:hypothetical protein OF83DRAFT_1080802 [Amylostereum chailletii]|nr:hypothetical protein OF83DRAFT_1080802 [Amylostereum chailletii]